MDLTPHNHNVIYQFGPYQLHSSKRAFTRNGETISLPLKATELLIMLVSNAGQLIEKDELLRQLWPDTFVEEANLAQYICLLRRALGDERVGPKFIETVTRRGYRFIARVTIIGAEEIAGADREAPDLGASQKPIVAVLPFLNATGNQDLEYLAEGVTDNIINNLSRVSKLRVMSRSAVSRYTSGNADPQMAGKELGATAVLVGKISSRPSRIVITAELVDTSTGWQLWGDTFDSETKNLLQIQEAITRKLLSTLKLKLTGDEEKRVTARYTENAEAYQSYLAGRYQWSRYTKEGIDRAIKHFRKAIEHDANYALAYAAIVDCYLRLATNYLPPKDSCSKPVPHQSKVRSYDEADPQLQLRVQWDWKGVERELRRANELKTEYPSAHQWYAAYRTSKQLYEISRDSEHIREVDSKRRSFVEALPAQFASIELTLNEQVQVYCAIVREQVDIGNYEAACRILESWWVFGNWPSLGGLNAQSCADLLSTAGKLASYVANTSQLPRGQRHAEELLNGSIALFEQLGVRRRAAEARMEVALCYHRQGLFDIARKTLTRVIKDLSGESGGILSLALIRLAGLERHSGRLKDALSRLVKVTSLVEASGPWLTARWHLELASTYKDLAVAESSARYLQHAKHAYLKALYEFQAVGHHRYVAVVENNLGYLLLNWGFYVEAEKHLLRARRLFDGFSDILGTAQVNETLTRLYIETKRYQCAKEAIEQAVAILVPTDAEAVLAEALITCGVVAARQGRYNDGKRSFEAAFNIAERCSDGEGAGRALLTLVEELGDRLDEVEKLQISEKLKMLLSTTQQKNLQRRVDKLLAKIAFTRIQQRGD
jgi:TolB-like protein/Tfp pilus assembly protein PilF